MHLHSPLSHLDVISLLDSTGVDPLGRLLDDEGADRIRAGIPAWHPRNDGEDDGGTTDDDGATDDENEGDGENSAADDENEGEDEGDAVTPAEAERLRQRAARAEAEARRLRDAQRRQRREQQEQDGEFERLYKEEQTAHQKTIETVKKSALRSSIISVASKLGFENPSLAPKIALSDFDVNDVVGDMEDEFQVDEREVEKILKRLVKTDKYLLKTSRRQADDAGRGDREDRDRDRSRDRDDDDRDRGGEPLNPRERLRRYHERQASAARD